MAAMSLPVQALRRAAEPNTLTILSITASYGFLDHCGKQADPKAWRRVLATGELLPATVPKAAQQNYPEPRIHAVNPNQCLARSRPDRDKIMHTG